MIRQKQPNAWSCLPTAFAMVIGVPVEDFIKDLGHDGSEIMWPKNPEPNNRRGFHIQEMIRLALTADFHVIQIQARPTLVSDDPSLPIPGDTLDWNTYFNETLHSHSGVLTGGVYIEDRLIRHAVAWDKTQIVTPLEQRPLTLDTFFIESFYIVEAIW